MPMRAYKASRDAYKSSVGHVGTFVFAVAAVAAAYLTGHPVGLPSSTWGHITALAGMLLVYRTRLSGQ